MRSLLLDQGLLDESRSHDRLTPAAGLIAQDSSRRAARGKALLRRVRLASMVR
ncbi:hypothetical protein [Promicromonospora xylanilytica]